MHPGFNLSLLQINIQKDYNWIAEMSIYIINKLLIGVFPKCSRTFAEFSEFRETDKSMKHELGSV